MKTTQAIKQDYQELMTKINDKLKSFNKDINTQKDDLELTVKEKKLELEKYKAKLQEQYQHLEENSENKIDDIRQKSEKVYNDAVDNLSSWLKELKTKN